MEIERKTESNTFTREKVTGYLVPFNTVDNCGRNNHEKDTNRVEWLLNLRLDCSECARRQLTKIKNKLSSELLLTLHIFS